MKFKYVSLTLLSLATVTNIGCSSGSDSGKNDGNKIPDYNHPDQPTPKPIETTDCSDVITQEQIDVFLKSGAAKTIGFVEGSTLSFCQQEKNINGRTSKVTLLGFKDVHYRPYERFQKISEIKDNGFELTIQVQTISEEVSEEDQKIIQQYFKKKDNIVNLKDNSSISVGTAVLADIPVYEVVFAGTQVIDNKNTRTYNLILNSTLKEKAQQALHEIQGGARITLAVGRTLLQVATISGALGNTMTWQRQPLVNYLNVLWAHSEAIEGARIEDADLKFRWIKLATSWALGLNADGKWDRENLRGGYEMAKKLWEPPTEMTASLETWKSIEALRFLTSLDAKSPAVKYQKYADELKPFFYGTGPEYFNEILSFGDGAYTADQEKVIFATAKARPKGTKEWSEVKDLCKEANYDTAKINLVFDLSKWLESYKSSQDSYNSAKKMVLTKNFNAAMVEAFKYTVRWLTSYSSMGEAIQSSERFVSAGLTLDNQELLKNTFLWINSYLSMRSSLEKAEKFVLLQKCDAKKISLVKNSFNFINSYKAAEASFNYVEKLIVDKGMDETSYLIFKNVFHWINSYKSSDVSFEYAEKYAVTLKISEATLQKLKNAFNRNYSTMSAGSALEKAEQEVLGNL